MNGLEQAEIMDALEQSYNRFPHEPQWVVLATATGEGLGSGQKRNAHVEVERVIALAAAASGNHERRAIEFGLGSIQYGLSVGTEGFEIVVFFANEWVLSTKFEGADTTILMDTLKVLPQAINPIVQLSQKKQ